MSNKPGWSIAAKEEKEKKPSNEGPKKPAYEYDPSIIIFERLFDIRVPNVYAIERSGGYMTMVNNDILDQAHASKSVVVMWNIATICEHITEGRDYSLIRRDDIQRIYDYTRQYLQAWKEELELYTTHQTQGPYDDLLKLDQMCNILFDLYKLHIDQGYADTKPDDNVDINNILSTVFRNEVTGERMNREYDDQYTRFFIKRMKQVDTKGDKDERRRKSFKK